MSVILRERKNKDSKGKDKSITFVLDIYKNGIRSYEFLNNLKSLSGGSAADKQSLKENRALAKKIAIARAQQLEASDYDVATEQSKKVIVIDWMKDYQKKYKKADIRVINAVVNKFSTFLTDNKMYGLLMKDFSESIAIQFLEKLKKDCKGEGPKSYYSRFRKIIKQAYRDKFLTKNPCEFIAPPLGDAKVKDILTAEELQLIAKTPTEAPEVKRSWLFCTQSGLRFVDVKKLTWGDINLAERKMKVVQSKTNKVVEVSLNSTAIELLGTPQGKKVLVFSLGSANGCNKSLNALVKRAKISKHITWHAGRHGFATNLIYSGTDIFTASILLGHSSLTHTKKYLRASSEMNQKAVDNLPKINL
jgi:integrase/recombinase XerD